MRHSLRTGIRHLLMLAARAASGPHMGASLRVVAGLAGAGHASAGRSCLVFPPRVPSPKSAGPQRKHSMLELFQLQRPSEAGLLRCALRGHERRHVALRCRGMPAAASRSKGFPPRLPSH